MGKKDETVKLCTDSQSLFTRELDQLKQSMINNVPSNKRMRLDHCPISSNMSIGNSFNIKNNAINDKKSPKSDATNESPRSDLQNAKSLNRTVLVSSSSTKANDTNKTFVRPHVKRDSKPKSSSQTNLNKTITKSTTANESANTCPIRLMTESTTNSKDLNKTFITTKSDTTLSKTNFSTKSDTALTRTITKRRSKDANRIMSKTITKSKTIDLNMVLGTEFEPQSNDYRSIGKTDLQVDSLDVEMMDATFVVVKKDDSKQDKIVEDNGQQTSRQANDFRVTNRVESMKTQDVQQHTTQPTAANLLVDSMSSDNLLPTPSKYNLRRSVRLVKKNYVF